MTGINVGHGGRDMPALRHIWMGPDIFPGIAARLWRSHSEEHLSYGEALGVRELAKEVIGATNSPIRFP